MVPVPVPLASVCGVALALGLRHGFDADHLAAIDGMVRRNVAGRPRLAKATGVLFSFGHGLVVAATAGTLSLALSDWQPPQWLEASGAVVSAIILLLLGVLNLNALRRPGVAIAPVGLRSRILGQRAHYLPPFAIIAVGVAFAVSFDTLSQAALFAFLATRAGGIAACLLVSGCFTLGMAVTDGMNGLCISSIVRRADRRGRLASRIMTLSIAGLGLLLGAAILVSLLMPPFATWMEENGLAISTVLILGVASTYLAAFWATRQKADSPFL